VIIPGLVNAHHHFFQTLTRAHPKAINKTCFRGCTSSIRSGGHILIATAFAWPCVSR
jgi:hypothetical protein